MLDKLEAIYGQKADVSLHVLQQRFYAALYQLEEGIAGHISRLQHLVNKMRNLSEKIFENMLIAKILNTLPANYAHFYSAWDSTPDASM